jgi:hypothetical protein
MGDLELRIELIIPIVGAALTTSASNVFPHSISISIAI